MWASRLDALESESLGPRLSCTAVQAILTRSGQDDIGVCIHARIFVDYLLMLVVTWCTGIAGGRTHTGWRGDRHLP